MPQNSRVIVTQPQLPAAGNANRHVCQPCHQTFTTRKSLLRHWRESRNHHNEWTTSEHVCHICFKSFSRPFDLRRHQSEQHGNGKEQCERCGRLLRKNAPHRNNQGLPCTSAAVLRDILDLENPTESHSPSLQLQGLSVYRIPSALGSDPSELESLASDLRSLNLQRSVPCGICTNSFKSQDPRAVLAHLQSHYEEFQHPFRCQECDIGFMHKRDLQKHLVSAERGDCGFKFEHSEPCPGHHPPVSKEAVYRRKRRRTAITDDDRFSLCYRVLEWQEAQLQAYQKSVADIVKESHASRDAFSMPPPAAVRSSVRQGQQSTPRHVHFVTNPPQSVEVDNDLAALESHLFKATCTGNTELASSLIDLGVNVRRLRDVNGMTAMHWAAVSGSEEMFKFLSRQGLDWDKQDSAGLRPSDYAWANGHDGWSELCRRHVIARHVQDAQIWEYDVQNGRPKRVRQGYYT